MNLLQYFNTDDGSLAEIEIAFPEPEMITQAFEFLFSCGARNVTKGGGSVWLTDPLTEQPFSGAGDASLVVAGVASPFHVVLSDVSCAGRPLPELGVFVDSHGLVIDYRMGAEWGELEIESLLELLRKFGAMGGVVSVPWWGVSGEQEFLSSLGDDGRFPGRNESVGTASRGCMTDELTALQAWYIAQCDGDWEHGAGVILQTLDNPGWSVTIELAGTALEGRPFLVVEEDIAHETAWLRCWVEEERFRGVCGPLRLNRVVQIFLAWAADTDMHEAAPTG